jgi:preprotein translocase subunit SecF
MVILGKEIDLTMIAAFLTIAGFSINDTIVLYDRIRENLRLLAKDNFGSIINKSINDVLSRTIITSLTVFSVSMILFFMGGEVIHDFALSMVIGTTLGVYSSVFICAPLTFEWEQKKRDRFKKSLKK